MKPNHGPPRAESVNLALYGGHGGAEDSGHQEVDYNPHTSTWRSPTCRTRGLPTTHHPEAPRTWSYTRTKEVRTRPRQVQTDQPEVERAAYDLLIKIRGDEEVKVMMQSFPWYLLGYQPQ